MPKRPRIELLASLPFMVAAASCVPAQGTPAPPAIAESARPGFDLDAPPPVSSLARLAPEDEARWQKSAKLFEAPSAAPAAPFAIGEDEGDRRRALDCLTAAVYHEARSEGARGQKAVAQVVLNRVRHPAFPASVCGVVYQGSGRRTGCQFSFTCDGSLGKRREPGAWEHARGIAAAALEGQVYAAVGNATHYHTRAILPYWASSLTRSTAIGAHIFYRWKGGAGRSAAFRQSYAGERGAAPVFRAAALRLKPEIAIRAPRVERVEAQGATIRIHRGAVPAPAAGSREQAGVRVHAGVPPPAATET